METKTPKFVQGYWRNKKETSKEAQLTGERGMLYLIAIYGLMLLIKAALTFPRTAMTILAAIGTSYLIVQAGKLYLAKRSVRIAKTKIIVNEQNKSTTLYL